MHERKQPGAAVVQSPLGDEHGKDGADERDYQPVDDEARTKQIKDYALRRRRSDFQSLRFRRHHGILPERNHSRNGTILSEGAWGNPND